MSRMVEQGDQSAARRLTRVFPLPLREGARGRGLSQPWQQKGHDGRSGGISPGGGDHHRAQALAATAAFLRMSVIPSNDYIRRPSPYRVSPCVSDESPPVRGY
jgi:hypothetical protein